MVNIKPALKKQLLLKLSFRVNLYKLVFVWTRCGDNLIFTVSQSHSVPKVKGDFKKGEGSSKGKK